MQQSKEERLNERLDDMKAAIRDETKKQTRRIEEQTKVEEAEIKKKIRSENQQKEEERHAKKLSSIQIEAKIRRSAKINESRMSRMSTRYELTQRLKHDIREALKKKITDERTYRPLMKSLIIQVRNSITQGLVKLMDEQVEVKCLKRDFGLVKSLIKECEDQFNKLSQEQTLTKIKTKLVLSQGQPLDTQYKDLLGGVVLASLRGRITCINTIDARLNYCLEDMLPSIRQGLFES